MTPITDKPHLFELWWERYMPNATQSEAWEAWQAAPRSDGVGVASRQAEPKTCIYPSCQHNGCLPDCEEQAEPSSCSSKQAPGLCSGVSEPSEARVEAAARVLYATLKGYPWPENWQSSRADELRTYARAVLQAADAVSAGVPEGFVLVPVEPTRAMLLAAALADVGPDADGVHRLEPWLTALWAAMLAAATGSEKEAGN